MAHQEQVERLKRDVKEWNTWRLERPEIRPDLINADLRDADLRDADLRDVNFRDANLRDANLRNADLSLANLIGTNLSHANLSGTNLRNANFSLANLTGAYLIGVYLSGINLSHANLNGAYLGGAYLSHADLSSANFRQTIFSQTLFAWVDLNSVEELETAKHNGPSIVHINSVILPDDEHTRLHFLRGVGFTETQIEYLPSLLTFRPIQYQSLFISYASQDEIIAKRLHGDFRKNDVPCWFALHDLQPGNYFRERIDQAIHSQDKLLLLLSEHSVQSGWVRYEVELALARENRQKTEVLFPIRLDDAIFHCTENWAVSLRETRHIGDFVGWQDNGAYQEAFALLLRHLRVAKSPTSTLS